MSVKSITPALDRVSFVFVFLGVHTPPHNVRLEEKEDIFGFAFIDFLLTYISLDFCPGVKTNVFNLEIMESNDGHRQLSTVAKYYSVGNYLALLKKLEDL